MCVLLGGKQVTGFFVEYIILKMFAGLGIEMTRGIALLQVKKKSEYVSPGVVVWRGGVI